MSAFLQDIRYSLRGLRGNPGFSLVVILTLALGIGANTAIFSIVDAVLLKPLPFRNPGQLVRIVDNAPGLGLNDIGLSVPEFQDLAQRSGLFEDVSAMWPVDGNLTGHGRPERIEFLAVSPNYFSLLGVTSQVGRVLGSEDTAAGFAEAVVISDGLWKRLFGSDKQVIGMKLRLDNDVYKVVGVMPPGFRHPGRTLATEVEMWGTAGFTADPFPDKPQRSSRMLPGAIARLKDGLPLDQAQERLNAFTAALRREFPNDYRAEARWAVQLQPLHESVSGNARPLLTVLLGAVAMLLLIACVNIANLLFARAAGRQREVSIRQAMGASRARLIRLSLTDSLILSLIAGVTGAIAASWSLKLLLLLVPARIPRIQEVALDGRVLLFALAVSVCTGILFGLAPALHASRGDVAGSLKETSNAAGRSGRQRRASGMLVSAEFAICLMLLMSAGMLLRTFWNLLQTDPGFQAQNVVVARVWLPQPNDPKADPYAKPEARAAFIREVLRRVRGLPGVGGAAITSSVPLSGSTNRVPSTIEGIVSAEPSLMEFVSVSPDYFEVMKTRVFEGRLFEESDQLDSVPVALVDRTTARKYWPNASPVGKRLKFGGAQSRAPWMTVVGVVGDIRHDALDADGVPHVYTSIYQRPAKTLGVMVRSSLALASLGERIRQEIESVDATLPVFGIRALDEMVDTSLAQRRFAAQLVGIFAGVALLLSAIGIYGVLAYSVGERTREFGIRMALGAQSAQVIQMVLWQGMRLILFGVVFGLIGAAGLARAMSGLLYGTTAQDPMVLFAAPVLLVGIAVLASAVPAYRATKVDPILALR